MPPTEVQRCKQCRIDKQKCVLQEGAEQCDRCIKRNCPCEDRRWPSPNRRLKTDAQMAEKSQRKSRNSELDVNAGNVQGRQPSSPSAGARNNNNSGSVFTGSNNNSAYPQYPYHNGFEYSSMNMNAFTTNNPQSYMPSSFGGTTQQAWPDATYVDNTGMYVDSSFYQIPSFYRAPATNNQRSEAYRKGQR